MYRSINILGLCLPPSYHGQRLETKATKALLNILKYQRSFGYFAPDEAFKLFDSLVLPILCYSSEIWGYDYSETIEKVHADFCKRVFIKMYVTSLQLVNVVVHLYQ